MKQSATILVVEDNKDMREGICDLLQFLEADFELSLLSANNGETGLTKISDSTPDLIISDIMMPQMDGIEFIKRVRQQPVTIDTPFIFLTARSAEEDILYGRLQGANLYLVKPFAGKELLELAKSQLQRSFQLREQFQQEKFQLQDTVLKLLSHEFRTPLTYVTAFHDLLEGSLDDSLREEEFRGYLHGMQIGCQRLIRLVENFINLIELRTGEAQSRFNVEAQQIDDLPQILATAVAICQVNSQLKTVNIHQLPDTILPPVWGVRKDLITIFVHLLENAIKFTHFKNGAAGNVTLSASVNENSIVMAIIDDGPGFPSNIKTKIYEPFMQYNRDYFEQQGAGIGLTIAKGLIEYHGGQLLAKSQEGDCSNFTITLPIYNSTLGKAPTLQPKQTEKIPATILIVEDDYNLLLGLKDLLEIFESNYKLTVLTANHAQKGLTLLKQNKPQLIISDIKMPKIDGYQLLEIVRSNPDWLEIPFIFLTALNDRHEQHRGWQSGVDEYITKPYKANQLLSLIVKQLDRYFQLKQNQARDFNSLKRVILNTLPGAIRLPLTALDSYVTDISEALDRAENIDTFKSYLEGFRESNLRLTVMVEEFMILVEQKTDALSKLFQLQAKPILSTSHFLTHIQKRLQQTISNEGMLTYTSGNTLPSIFGVEHLLEDCLQRLLKVIFACCPGHIKSGVYLSATNKDDLVIIMLRLTAPFPLQTSNIVNRILQWEAADTIQLAPFAPSLQIAQGYAELHKGYVSFQNEPTASFMLSLPVYHP